MRYNTYHSNLVINHKLGNLPPEIKKLIPKSTLHYWKKIDISKILGIDEKYLANLQAIDFIQTFVQHKKLLKITRCLYYIFKTQSNIIDSFKNKSKILYPYKDEILHTIKKVKDIISLKRALLYFNITYQQYSVWNREVLKCKISISENFKVVVASFFYF